MGLLFRPMRTGLTKARRGKGTFGNIVLLFMVERWLMLVKANETFPHNQEEGHNDEYDGSDV